MSLEVGQIHCYRHSFLYESYETLLTALVFDVIHNTADLGWLNLPHIDYRILVDDHYISRGAIGSDMKLYESDGGGRMSFDGGAFICASQR
jgi:hypothetical protein